MVLVFVTVSTLAFPYPQDEPVLTEEVEVAAIDDASPPLAEGEDTVDARHHYSSFNNQRPASAYRPSYARPAYNRPAAATSYYNRPQNYGSAGHHNTGSYNSGYGNSAGHRPSSNYYGSNAGSHHGAFGGLGWREGQKSGDVAAPSDEALLVPDADAGTGASGVVFQQ